MIELLGASVVSQFGWPGGIDVPTDTTSCPPAAVTVRVIGGCFWAVINPRLIGFGAADIDMPPATSACAVMEAEEYVPVIFTVPV